MTSRELTFNRTNFPSFLGFENIFDIFENGFSRSSYPPYDIIKLDDNKTRVDIALAGWDKEDLNITVEDEFMVVSGKTEMKEEQDTREYAYKGIGKRQFQLKFPMTRTVEIKDAKFENGILSIDLENIVPEEKKPKQIPII
jgi:molecular chaperone IbpA